MKKSIETGLTAVLAAAMLAGCGSAASTSSSAPATDAASSTAAVEEAAAGSSAAASDGKVYRIATDTTFAPFEFEDDNGKMVGIDLDLLDAIAKDQGFQYKVDYVGFSAAVTALESGEADGVIAGMSITDERKQKYDFSEAYYNSGVGMAVLKDSDIASYDDLKGKTVAAKIGTTNCDFAESIADKYGFTVTQFEDSSTMYQDVLAGTSAACFDDYPVLGYEIQRGVGFKLPLPMEEGADFGFATMKGTNPELVKMFNAGLEDLKKDGTYDKIISTYISK